MAWGCTWRNVFHALVSQVSTRYTLLFLYSCLLSFRDQKWSIVCCFLKTKNSWKWKTHSVCGLWEKRSLPIKRYRDMVVNSQLRSWTNQAWRWGDCCQLDIVPRKSNNRLLHISNLRLWCVTPKNQLPTKNSEEPQRVDFFAEQLTRQVIYGVSSWEQRTRYFLPERCKLKRVCLTDDQLS